MNTGEPNREFGEKLSPFLHDRLATFEQTLGTDSAAYRALAGQYCFDEQENEIDWKAERRRHYEAELLSNTEGAYLKGVERLYRRVALIDITTACVAHCRYCLRRLYPGFTLTPDEISEAARFFGDNENRDDLREILITGGDPLLVPDLLEIAIDAIGEFAPNIEAVRIGSRLPVQQPNAVTERVLHALRSRTRPRIELATQVNHPAELARESTEAYMAITDAGVRIYNQQVLLRGVNDDLATLVELYDNLRSLRIEAHYMFHCVPVRGVSHLRTSIAEGLTLIRKLSSSGWISGRAKPMYTAMTDIGKVTLYEGTIVSKRGDMVLLQTEYLEADRRRWNPSWTCPDSVGVDPQGRLTVWYQDAETHNEGWPTTYFIDSERPGGQTSNA